MDSEWGWDRWMDDLQFYALFNSISVMSGQWEGDNERFYAMYTMFMIEKISSLTSL